MQLQIKNLYLCIGVKKNASYLGKLRYKIMIVAIKGKENGNKTQGKKKKKQEAKTYNYFAPLLNLCHVPRDT